MREAPMHDNPYYWYFKQRAHGGSLADELGDVYRAPTLRMPRYGGRLPYGRVRLGSGWPRFLRFLQPVFRKVAAFVKTPLAQQGLKHVVDVATKVANDAIEGKNVKESIATHVTEKAKKLLTGTGRRIKANRKRKQGHKVVRRGAKRKRHSHLPVIPELQ